jgi:hypothetical protein
VDPEGDNFTMVALDVGGPVNASGTGPTRVLSAPADFHGYAPATMTLRDAHGAQSNVSLQLEVRPLNDAPRPGVALGPFTIMEDAPAAQATFSLSGTAVDPDGDPLTYSATAGPGVAVLVVNQSLTLVPGADFTGDTQVTVVASDGALSLVRTVDVRIEPVNDAPRLTAPPGQPVAREGEPFHLNVSATDPDTASAQLRFSFWLDGLLVTNATPESSFSHAFGFDDAGFHLVRVEATDGALATALDISVFVSQTNRLPAAQVLTPAGSSYRVGEVVSITGRGTDPDGDALSYRWIVDGSLAGQGETVTLTGLAAGPHTAVLFVSDGDRTVAAEFAFTVSESAPGPGTALAAGALAAAAALAWRGTRRRF